MANELPSRSGAFRRCAAVAAMGAAAAVLIAGCAAGQDTQTVNQRPPIDGASADAGAISIRTASVMSDDLGGSSSTGGSGSSSSSAQLRLVIINNSPQQVQLESVSSPVAGSAQVSGGGTSDTMSPGAESSSETAGASASSSASPSGSAAASGSATASGSARTSRSATASRSVSGSATPTGSASASASTSDTASASASSTPANTPIAIPPGQSIQVGFGADGPSITLTGLTTELFPAQTVPVTFTFGDGTTIKLDVPVQLPSSAASAPVISDATEVSEPNG